MKITPIKTSIIEPNQPIEGVIDLYVPLLKENDILAITSKIISYAQGRVVLKEDVLDKTKLIQKEAEYYVDDESSFVLTIKENILLPSAGIDESNARQFYVLYPLEPQKEAQKIWLYLKEKFNLKNVGVLITDSHTTILRLGVTGIAVSWYGFRPLYSYVGKPDIFGRTLQVSQTNIVDGLAAAAVLEMGEGAEQTPLALIEEAPRVQFMPSNENISIDMEKDLYSPILRSTSWKKGGTS